MTHSSAFGAVSRRDRRALSLGATAIGMAIALLRGVPAVIQWNEASVGSARETMMEAERARRSVMGARALADTMSARSSRLVALAPSLLDGASAATAGATLASLVSGAAAASNAKLSTIQLGTTTEPGDSLGHASRAFARVSVRAGLTTDIRGLSRLLLALEQGPTLLAIDELSITQPEPAVQRDRPEMLHVDLVVAGLAHLREKGDQ